MRKTAIAAVMAASMLMAGCATNQFTRSDDENAARAVQIDPKLYHITAAEAADSSGPIHLPQNYDPNNYKLIRLAASFYPLDAANNSFAKENSETVSTLMENEISKLKRFTVLSRHQMGAQALRDEKRYQDKAGVSSNLMRMGLDSGADYVLTAGVAIKTEKYDRLKNHEIFITVTVPYQLINVKTKEIVEADTAEGRAVRTFYMLPNGTYIGGFNIDDKTEAAQAVNEASFRALKVIANMLGNKLPVGGRVSGFKLDRFAMDCGHQQGLMGKQVAVLYATDMGIDIPIAYGELEPGKNKTTGRILRWNNEAAARDLVEKAKANGMAFLREYEVYAVSAAMPEPPEWEKYYSK